MRPRVDTLAPMTVERMSRAKQAAAAAGLDAVLVTPGADLRYLTGYDAVPLERLTCLVLQASGDPVLVVPALERPAAEASPAAATGVDIIDWPETDDPVALVAKLVRRARRVAVDDHMWAEKVLRFRAAMLTRNRSWPGRCFVSCESGNRWRRSKRCGPRLRPSTGSMPGWGSGCKPGGPSATGHAIADAIIAEGHQRVDFVIVASGPNSASPPRRVRSGDRGR